MKKIIIFTEGLGQGGVETSVSTLSHALAEVFDVYVVVCDPMESVLLDHGGKLISINLDSRTESHIFSRINAIIRGTCKLRKLKKKINADVCISFKETQNLINILSGFSKNIISVREYKSVGTRLKGFIRLLSRFIFYALYSCASKIVSLSEGIKEDLRYFYFLNRKKIVTINNGYDFEKIEKAAQESLLEHESLFEGYNVLLTVGRCVHEKAQIHILRALSRLDADNLRLRLVILGDGPYIPVLLRKAEELGLKDKVFMLGYQKNPYKYMKHSKIFILSSLYEGFGNVIIEAMACKLPVISTDCPTGPREIFGFNNFGSNMPVNSLVILDNAIFVPRFDGILRTAKAPLTHAEEQLVLAINTLLGSDELREKIAQSGYESCKNFTWSKFQTKWIEVINFCLSTN